MADIFSPEKRSEIMSRIRGKDTKPELIVAKDLRKNNIYFRKHHKGLQKISIDIARPRDKKAVFIDGDFWHGRDYDIRAPKLSDFWRKKIQRNMERDLEQAVLLEAAGWSILRVWESEIITKATSEAAVSRIKAFLTGRIDNMD